MYALSISISMLYRRSIFCSSSACVLSYITANALHRSAIIDTHTYNQNTRATRAYTCRCMCMQLIRWGQKCALFRSEQMERLSFYLALPFRYSFKLWLDAAPSLLPACLLAVVAVAGRCHSVCPLAFRCDTIANTGNYESVVFRRPSIKQHMLSLFHSRCVRDEAFSSNYVRTCNEKRLRLLYIYIIKLSWEGNKTANGFFLFLYSVFLWISDFTI